VFVIDELDRCRPPFAPEVLENIKHLFSVPNIVFILSMNRSQIEESIRCEYGTQVHASKYLQKFVGFGHIFQSREKDIPVIPKSI
jgi:predicted KAP-like P-loop ATPase